MTLTAARLREVLRYDQETGVFVRLSGGTGYARRGVPIVNDGDLRIKIMVDAVRYKASRLAWLYVHGQWPEGMIDHKNGQVRDNRMSNLRDVTASVNSQNKRLPRAGNKVGLIGVTPRGDGFVAQIEVNGKNHYLGTYLTPLGAHRAYVKAKREMHAGCTL